MLIGPMRSLGVTLGLAQRATASGARIFQVLDREPRIVEPPGAPPLPAGNGHVQLRGVTLRYDERDEFGAAYVRAGGRDAATARQRTATARRRAARARCSATSTSTCPPGTTVALVGAHRLGQDQPRLADLAPV